MPPKEKSTKKKKGDTQSASASELDSPGIKDAPSEQDDPQPEPSTSTGSSQKMHLETDKPPPSKEDIMKSPVCSMSPDKIEARKAEPVSVRPKERSPQPPNEPFEKVVMLHLDKNCFTDDQRKSWLNLINKIRRNRSLSSLPSDYETEASKEVEHSKYTEEEMSIFCEKLGKYDYSLSAGDFAELQVVKLETETSSDPESDAKESEVKPPVRRSPRHKHKLPSWKEFKKGKNFGAAYFKWQFEHSGVKKVIEKTVKAIYMKKKQEYIQKNDGRSIEVGKDEVQDFLFEAVGFMERRYLWPIHRVANYIQKSVEDDIVRECESGTYDSQDEWLPNKETISSRINKMSVSVPPAILEEYGLLDLLIKTLPLTLNDTDPADTLEFTEILKRAQNRVPEHISIKNLPSTSKPEKERHASGNTVICAALVEPPPNLERLENSGAKDYLKQFPTEEIEESETKSTSDGVKNQSQLEPKESESESVMQVDSSEVSEDLKSMVDSAEDTEDMSAQQKRGRSPEPPSTPSKKKNLPM